MDELKKIFKNKRIVIIGPASELQMKDKTYFFSTFDLIVNINGTYILDDKYGERCDVLFNTTNDLSIDRLIKNKNCIKNKNIKYLIGTNIGNEDFNKHRWIKYCSVTKNINKNIKCFDISKYCKFSETNFNKTFNYDCQLHTGTFALIFLLSCELKELYIDGITFYNDGKFGKVWNNNYHENLKYLHINTHKGTMDMEKKIINLLISKAPFKVNFDESYCPLKKN